MNSKTGLAIFAIVAAVSLITAIGMDGTVFVRNPDRLKLAKREQQRRIVILPIMK